MPDTKITALTAISTVDPAVDVLPIVDVSDTTMAASGTTKKITSNQILGAGGTATLASATITGDLTVRTNRLATTTTGVGIGTASPIVPLDVRGGAGAGALFLRTTDPTAPVSSAYIQTPVSTGFSPLVPIYGFWYQNCGMGNPASDAVTLITASTERYRIDSAGTNTWSNVGGAGTAMTLNSTGLGVGGSPTTGVKLHVGGGNAHIRNAAGGQTKLIFGPSANYVEMGGIIYDDTDGTLTFGVIQNYAAKFITNNTERLRIKPAGQVRFVPLAADPAGAEAGDVYYNSVSNRLKYYNGTAWTLI